MEEEEEVKKMMGWIEKNFFNLILIKEEFFIQKYFKYLLRKLLIFVDI